MMTYQSNSIMTLVARVWAFNSYVTSLALLVACVLQSYPVSAQNIIYSQPIPSSYPSSVYPSASYPSHSYPTSSYPTSSYPETIISERVIHSSLAPTNTTSHTNSQITSENSRTAAPKKPSKPFTQNEPVAQSEPVTRLASTSIYRPSSRLRDENRYGYRLRNFDTVSTYRPDMIESARQSAAQFRLIAQSAHDIAAEIAVENSKLADQWAEVAETYNVLFDRVSLAHANLDSTARDFEDVHEKLDHYGLTPTIGILLRNKKEQLDKLQVQDSQAALTSNEIQRLRQQQLQLEMFTYDGSDPIRESNQILADDGYDQNSPKHLALVSLVQRLLRERHQWIQSLTRVYQDYQQKLGELDTVAAESTNLARDYRGLINRHITWIRSGDPIGIRDVQNLRGGFAALFDPKRSDDFGPTIQHKMETHAAGAFALLFWIIAILLARWRAKSWLIGIGGRKKMRESLDASRKLWSAVLTVALALAFPAILYLVGRWLGTGVVSESTLYAASGFYAASLVALFFEIPRQLMRNLGYLHKHVDVELPRRERAMKYLTTFGFALVVAAYAITVMGLVDHGAWNGSFSRFGFIASMLLVAFMAHLALRPSGGYIEPLIAKFGGSVIHRIRLVIYLAGIGFPLIMIALSALGYGFTADELVKRAILTLVGVQIGATLWAATKILSAKAWLILTGSTPPPPKYDEYGLVETPSESVSGTLAEHSLELKHQLAFLSQCALVLGSIACFGWLWIDVFPNVRTGNPVVWNVEDTVTETTTDASGQMLTSTFTESTPVTALHLLLAAATLFLAFQLAKLLPAMFDALVLQRVSFDEGMEHLSLVLGRFLLFGVGCFVACKWVGIRWQAIQWLAVGLTIGLGFGLQDMVRNLFGGLIVLFEKPARLGDLITVGRVTGRVASQKLRTTVVSDDKGREVIIPNKNFVNEDVVNWRGAGRLHVIPIEVAVKRNERPADICRSLQELAIAQDDVLITPAPQATLVCVAKGSQRIEVRAWIEQGQDPSRYRESLLKVTREYLRDRKLLAPNQPRQPALQNATESVRTAA